MILFVSDMAIRVYFAAIASRERSTVTELGFRCFVMVAGKDGQSIPGMDGILPSTWYRLVKA